MDKQLKEAIDDIQTTLNWIYQEEDKTNVELHKEELIKNPEFKKAYEHGIDVQQIDDKTFTVTIPDKDVEVFTTLGIQHAMEEGFKMLIEKYGLDE